jgi:NDP-sugar pyrophosphorylase family protein
MPVIRQAMIFAAGLGTRLYPLTGTMPKALVEVAGKTMLERVIEKLKAFGVQRIVINLHHFPDQILWFVRQKNNFGIEILYSDESDLLLDTGGGLKKAAPLFDLSQPILLHNVDVLSGLDFSKLADFHYERKAMVTLFVQERKSSRYFLFDENQRLSGWRNVKTGEEIIPVKPVGELVELAFNGVHLINPEFLDLITEDGKCSIVQVYLRLAAGHQIVGYRNDDTPYIDIGKPESLKDAGLLLFKENL